MAKAIKLQNDTYLDSSSIVNNQKPLSQILNCGIFSNKSNGIDITLNTNMDKFGFLIIGKDNNGNGSANVTLVTYFGTTTECVYTNIVGSKVVTRTSQKVFHINANQYSYYYVILPPCATATLTIS